MRDTLTRTILCFDRLFICVKKLRATENELAKHSYIVLRVRRSLELYGYLQKRISVMRVGVYTSDSNNWMPRVYTSVQ